ncbi:pentapeptide repeat-containing protein [Nocardia wallacei]|uniref:pentapeptide repeat-containing protein n=1 Tax=Nocardia wallacei TaxID=480035 RepID=UPI0024558BDC|nr:pentapeptide repeat-containing protein [Nocardia wallacei]
MSAAGAKVRGRSVALRVHATRDGRAALARRAAGVRLLPAVTVALVAGFGVAVGAYAVLRWITPTSGAKAAPIDVTKVALTVVAGVGGVVALVIAYRRQRDLEQGRFVERFGAAAAQLGAADVAVRIAGVYAMAGVADESDSMRRQQCIDVLCGYLRLPYMPELGVNHQTKRVRKRHIHDDTDEEEDHFEYRQNDREVRQTIVRVIADHLRTTAKGYSWSPSDFDFRTALLEDLDFRNVTFLGTARFDGATFAGTTDFRSATFSRTARFGQATFTGSAWFDNVTFTGSAHFGDVAFARPARFFGAKFARAARFGHARFAADAQFGNTTFYGDAWFDHAAFAADAKFEYATFAADARFGDTTFSGNGRFDNVQFAAAQFDRATCAATLRFVDTTFSVFASFERMAFFRSEFLGTMFAGSARFNGATFSGTTRFANAQFARVWFDDTTFSADTVFEGATFAGIARFVCSTFSGITLFEGATFSGGARFDRARFIRPTSFEKANFGSGLVSFANPWQWGPPDPVFDWDEDLSRKPPTVEPRNWPPVSAAPQPSTE